MSEFKVGDRVKIVNPILKEQQKYKNHVCTVTCDNGNGVYVSGMEGKGNYFFDSELEYVSNDVKTTKVYIDSNSLNVTVDDLYPHVLNTRVSDEFTDFISDIIEKRIEYKNKEENEMRNEVLELWYQRQRNNIAKKYKKYVEEYIEKNYSFVNDYKQLIKDFEDNLEYLYTLNNKDELFILKENNSCNVFKYVVDTDKISYEADEYFSKDKLEELNEIENVYDEIKALLSMSSDIEYQQSVLIEYGIIDKKTKRMSSNEDSSK